MTVFDYVVVLVVGVSVLVSVMRGFLREVMALLAWVVAFWIANLYTASLAPLLPASIPSPELRLLAAFVVVFLAALLIMTLLGIALSHTLKAVGLGPMDRALGAVFGLARGLAIVWIGVLLAGLTSLPKESAWKNAMLSAPLEALVLGFRPWLPDDVAKRLRYD